LVNQALGLPGGEQPEYGLPAALIPAQAK